eukprot:8426151-Pyramimonas_sp.AAC.2
MPVAGCVCVAPPTTEANRISKSVGAAGLLASLLCARVPSAIRGPRARRAWGNDYAPVAPASARRTDAPLQRAPSFLSEPRPLGTDAKTDFVLRRQTLWGALLSTCRSHRRGRIGLAAARSAGG